MGHLLACHTCRLFQMTLFLFEEEVGISHTRSEIVEWLRSQDMRRPLYNILDTVTQMVVTQMVTNVRWKENSLVLIKEPKSKLNFIMHN